MRTFKNQISSDDQWVNETTKKNYLVNKSVEWKVASTKTSSTWCCGFRLSEIYQSVTPISLRSDTQHNSQRVHVHVNGGAFNPCWGVFTNPLSPRLVALWSRLHTHAAHPGWYATAHGCTCTPQRARVPTSATNEAAYARFFPPSAANYIRAVRGYTNTWKCSEMFSFCRRALLVFLLLRQLQEPRITQRLSTETL